MWRRSYDVPPPAITPGDPRQRLEDPRYGDLPPDALPFTECLADVVRRAVPYWQDAIVPDLKAVGARGGAVLVVAHGTRLRAIPEYLEDIDDEEIVGLEIPTGVPYRCLLDDQLRIVEGGYLGVPAERTETPTDLGALEGASPSLPGCAPAPPATGITRPFRHLSSRSPPPRRWCRPPCRPRRRRRGPRDGASARSPPRTRLPVDLGVPSLAAEALGLGEGHPLDPQALEVLLDVIELERLDDCDHELQGCISLLYRLSGCRLLRCPVPVT